MIFLQDPDFTLYHGHVIDCLKQMADASVDCVVTSPPYWGLRNYGVQPQPWGVKDGCDHAWTYHHRRGMSGGHGEKSPLQSARTREAVMFDSLEFRHCRFCGGWMVPLGLEHTPELFVEHLVMVFNEIRRVLKDTGTVWVNLGDTYSEKQLVGVPWMFAFAMKKEGWILRRDNIWSKPNPMPESATDRTTTAHEYFFHFSKLHEYYYDADSIREPHTTQIIEGWVPTRGVYGEGVKGTKGPAGWHQLGRNKRSVWEIPVQPYEEAHFATYPPKLISPIIQAACPQGGTVLDPFIGSGTTAQVARELGRKTVGIELNLEYCSIISKRTQQQGLLNVLESETSKTPHSGTEATGHIPGVLSDDGPDRAVQDVA